MITAFTATASPQVLERMSEILFDGQAHVVRSESDRQNIHYYVKKAACKKKEALKLALTEEKPMIIFCGTRFNAADMAKELNAFFNKKVAQFYHAGFEKSEKERIEQWFYNSTDGILCATCAYGMGVDKKNIKTVVHLEASTTAEAYIQEAGRGGRDGSVAKAILIWSLEDSLKFDSFGKSSRQYSMKIFAETTECRRQVLLNALGAEQAVCSGCDVCDEKNGIKEKDEPSDWQIALKLIKKYKNFYTPETLQEELTFRMNKYFVKTFGKKFWNHNDSKEVVKQIQNSEFRIQRKLSLGFSRSRRNSRKKRT
jgi:ATP-dependent DNA helicase RecQ